MTYSLYFSLMCRPAAIFLGSALTFLAASGLGLWMYSVSYATSRNTDGFVEPASAYAWIAFLIEIGVGAAITTVWVRKLPAE